MAADLTGKLETVVELKSPPEKFYNVWSKQAHHIPNHSPDNIQAVDVHEGDWETSGSTKIWNYTIGGKTEVFKETVEMDDENMTIALVGIEGDVMTKLKVYKPIWKLTPNGEGSLAHCTIEYEKLNESDPPPQEYMDFMVSLTTDIDEGLTKA